MKNDLSELIRELSEIYDVSNEDTYVTVYINKDANLKFLDKREKDCNSLLKGEEQKNFSNTIEQIKKLIKEQE